jgi:uncharacterized repeat protein (TIGR03803 family)
VRPITPQRMVLVFGFILLNLFLLPTLAAGQQDGSEVGVYSFNGSSAGPRVPYAGLIRDSLGNLYGTTEFGGTYNHGTVFEITPNASENWTESVLYSFTGSWDGGQPFGTLIFDTAGNLYGTTNFGGSANCKLGCGTIFKLTPTSAGWAETVVYTFTGGSDGREPYAGLVSDAQGNFYGTTLLGGNPNNTCNSGCGTVFQLSYSNSAWKANVLYTFAGANDGAWPHASLIFDGAGNLYSTTKGGGTYGSGTVFRLTAGSWTESVLYNFTGGQDGKEPPGRLILDTAGNLYGTTSRGGVKGYGVVFKLAPASQGSWQEEVLHSFGDAPAANPVAGLVMDTGGNLYGTTLLGAELDSCGGGCGTLFKLSPSSSGSWKYNVLHLFGRAADGYHPSGQLIQDAAGNLYGTTQAGGAYGAGVVFEISVNPQNGVRITTSALPNGGVAAAYSTTLTATGGTLPYSWTVTSGALPAGLSLSNGGTISGTPTSAGQSNFTVQVTDSSAPVQKAAKPFSISIIATVLPLTITTASLPSGTVGSAYSSTLTAIGGTLPYSWTVTSGSLPAGLSLSNGGTISGTPTSAGQSNFTVQVADSSLPVQKATKPLSISISSSGASLKITTASLPNGIVGTAYSTTLTASGGTTPYSWTLVSGALPAGLSLSVGGTISGTPTSAGPSNFTVQVTDSSNPVQQASKAFDPSIFSKLAITGTINPNATDGVFYSSTDQASGGVPPYTWSVVAGALPPGLTLGAVTGTISGTPNQDGTYNFTLKVVDSGVPGQSATQADKITVSTSTNTAWTLQTTGVGWQFVAPDGAPTCKYNGVSKVDDTDLQSAGTDAEVLSKYGSWSAWAQEQSNRLTSLGFTAAGMYSYRYASNSPADGLPFAPTYGTSGYSMQDTAHDNLGPYHAKDLGYIPEKNGMKCGPNIYQGSEIDPYDPNTQAAFNDYLANDFMKGWDFTKSIIVVPDEADFLFGLDQANNPSNAHPDIGLMIAANNPMVIKSRPGSPYYQSGNYTYTDKELYAKQALRNFLEAKYGSSLGALNTAWGTNYTTWDTSDPAGLAGITDGTYQSWGGNAACSASGNPYACCTGNGTGSCTQGTGFLDENGFNIIKSGQSCGGKTGNGPQETDSWSDPVQIQTDIDAFVAALAATYAQELRSAWLAACGSTCPPMALPVYDGPWNGTAGVYVAMAPSVDLFWIAPSWYPSLAAYTGEVQNIINNDGGKPVIVANYFRANPNSWVVAGCDAGSGQDCQTTQDLRGSFTVSFDQGSLSLKNSNGEYAVIGLEHWSLYDSHTEGRDFGLFTPHDNGYDGSAASTAPSRGSCAINTNYTQPAICQDSNGNYEGLAVASCTSGGSSPTWNTNFNGITKNDGSCTWFNEGPYTPKTESTNWGNTLLPMANLFTAGICDP